MRVPIFLLMAVIAAAAQAQTFTVHRTTYSVGPNPSAIVASDLNGDNIPDIATADMGRLRSPRDERPANNEISLLMSTAPLQFNYLEPLPVGFAPFALALANIDARKALDVLTVSFMDNRQYEGQRDLTLFRNLGENHFDRHDFTVPDDRTAYRRSLDADGLPAFEKPGLSAIRVADLNHDGLRDVVATAWSSDLIVTFLGHAETYFAAPTWFSLPGGPRDLELVDLTGDGTLDLAVILYLENRIDILKGNDQGEFEPLRWLPSHGRLPQSIRSRDMNGDGSSDLIVSHCDADDSIVIFFNDGKGSFPTSQELMLGTNRDALEAEIRDIEIGDFNSDGKPDIAAACYAAGNVVVLINESPAGMPLAFSRQKYTFDDGRPRALCAADFNGDNKPDLAVALWDKNAVGLLLGR